MSFLLPLLFVVLNLASSITNGDDHHKFVYNGFTGANLSLDGTAMVTPNGLVELTNDGIRLKGHAFYPSPLQFRNSPNGTVQSFSVSFVFGIIPIFSDLNSGHGISFVVAPSKNFSDAIPAQYFGLFNSETDGNSNGHIFAVELDTVQNREFKDINDNHVGIDVNSLTSLKSYPAGYYDESGMFRNLSLVSMEAMQVWVDYDREATQINVTMAPLHMAKPVKPLLSASYNLSELLMEPAYIGFSSSTGAAGARHYLLGWSFNINGPAPAIDIAKLPKLPTVGPKSDPSKKLKIFLPIATAAFLMAVGAAIFLLVRRRMRYAELQEDWEIEFGPHRFTYKDLFHATEGFQNKNLIGAGGAGRVYKGTLIGSKQDIAVKKISHNSKQSMKQFVAEIVSIGHLQHRNLVRLLGYCRRKGELILVYEYMPNGSLENFLYGQDGKCTLDWDQRFKIIKGIASGLLYLHEEWEKVVIHRDVKPSNILLDNEMNAKIGDFGLSRLHDHGANLQTTHVVGTIGYLAPEIALNGKVSPLADVFSFGILALEIICGQKPVKQNAQGVQHTLVDWVLEHWHKGSLVDAVDANLQTGYDIAEVRLVLQLGLLCSHPSGQSRPSMRQVMQYLNGDMPLPETFLTHPDFGMFHLLQERVSNLSAMSYPSLA
uniref:non-specific serine/threonine protein kinase n=1 Tax=Leersia perrieri TaxID=77586 RepID=A0A0D9WV67_9ORYZ